jgi:ketosteroid isomerase-like protein
MDIREWIEAYAAAWESADPEGAAFLFTDDAEYRSHPLREPHTGREGVREYWAGVTAAQQDVRVRMGEPIVHGRRAAVEWWTTMVDAGGVDRTLTGCLVLAFADDGRCRGLRECWNAQPRRVEPPEGWGAVGLPDPPDADLWARAWAGGYEAAWRAKDVEGAVLLYSPDVLYRSQPFREPHVGHEGVRAYTTEAYAIEEDQDPRFGVPVSGRTSAVIEYWTSMREEGQEATLIGTVVLRFDREGLVEESREYWHLEPGRHEPYEGWGV